MENTKTKTTCLESSTWSAVLGKNFWPAVGFGFTRHPLFWLPEELYLFRAILQDGAVFPSFIFGGIFPTPNLIYKHQRIQNVLPAISAFQFQTEFTFCLVVDTGWQKKRRKKATNFSFLLAKINKCCHTHKFSFDS